MNQKTDFLIRNRRVMVTRPAGQAENLYRLIESVGGKAIHFPVIDIHPQDNPDLQNDLLAGLDEFGLVIFVSRNAVHYTDRLAPGIFSKLNKMTVFAMGIGTTQELRDKGVKKVIYKKNGTGSEALMEVKELQSENISGQEIVIVRGVGGRELLGEVLQERGAMVRYIEVYRREKPEFDPMVLRKIWHVDQPDAIVVTSAEGMQNLIDMTDQADRYILFNTPLVVISPRLQAVATSLGFKGMTQIASDSSDNGLMQVLVKLFGA